MDYNLPNYEQRLHEYTSYHTLEPCTTGLTLTVGPLPDGPFRDHHLGSRTVRPYVPSTTLKMFGARFSFGFGSDILNAALSSVLGSRWGPSPSWHDGAQCRGLRGDFCETIPTSLNFGLQHMFFLYPKKFSYSSRNAYIKKIRMREPGKAYSLLKNVKNA